MLTTLAFAQDMSNQDQGAVLKSVKGLKQSLVSKAARLGTSHATDADTMYVGHTNGTVHSHPWNIGVGPYRPGVGGSYNGMWDFDSFTDGAGTDSAQGWVPYAEPNARTLGTRSDDQRPWNCLDWGNRLNAGPVQGRTPGIVSVWHADNGQYVIGRVGQDPLESPQWAPLAGNKSAWCGLRAGDDFGAIDDVLYGGTGNHINGNVLFGREGTTASLAGGAKTQKNFPGYANQWDQILYRDVRVATGSPLTVSFLYETQMDTRADQAEATCKGWFDRDPLSMQQGGVGAGASNFISASAYLGSPVRKGPIDSFMVYVGVPTNPEAVQYSDGDVPRPIFDLKRRWFSEVIAIDMPYTEILSTFGRDSVYRESPFSATVNVDAMIAAQGEVNGGGIIRIAFRSKTNANFSDEQNTGGSFISTNKGAVRVDDVAITGCSPAFTTSGFENAGEINNNVELATTGATLGPDVGAGYALSAWHATGKPPKLMAHLHPLSGGNIGPGNYYPPLEYADLCGVWNSPIRQCNINNVVMSSTDHDLLDAAGGEAGTPFKENRGGYMSPAINLVTPDHDPLGASVNDVGLDRLHVETNEIWLVWYDLYTGLFADFYSQGNLHGTTLCSYPTIQKNKAKIWGDTGVTTAMYWWGDRYCLTNWDEVSVFINTSNSTNIPDSVKVVIEREQRCISVGAPNCSSTDGHYTDNIALAFPPPVIGSSDNISVDIWDWYNDAFPANETPGLPGTAAFDTCAAHIGAAFQRATPATDTNRPNISADSMFIQGNNSTGNPVRMDCIFRVFPGPGNYVQIGNKASGLRQLPTSTTPALSGDNSFWGQYMANPGETVPGTWNFSKGTHAGAPSGWNVDVWNQVRCDTVEINLFPAIANNSNLPAITIDRWMSTIHDADPKFDILGISKNRCFLVDASAGAVVNETNITCGDPAMGTYPPSWTSTTGSGYDIIGGPTTKEYTKIFPDGLFTPGSSIQYFLRMSQIGDPGTFVMTPDTNIVWPQTQMGPDYDGKRWENISILPDKWKDFAYGGFGSACLLVIDQQDRRGNERQWVGIADSIGATRSAKYGAHNGWHATGAYVSPLDGSTDYEWQQNCGDDLGIAIYKNGGQPGTTWDLYNVKSAESPSGSVTAIGSRLAPAAIGKQSGKDTKIGPMPEMLKSYYTLLFFLCGDMKGAYFGAIPNKGSKDIEMVQDFLTASGPRGAWFMGDAFVEGHDGYSTLHNTFLNTNLGVSLRDPSYYALSGSSVLYPDLIPSAVINTTGRMYSVTNSCTFTNDVLYPTALVGAVAGTTYQNLGTAVNAIAGVYTPWYAASVHDPGGWLGHREPDGAAGWQLPGPDVLRHRRPDEHVRFGVRVHRGSDPRREPAGSQRRHARLPRQHRQQPDEGRWAGDRALRPRQGGSGRGEGV